MTHMKVYFSYLNTAFFNFWIIAFYLGFSAGFASYIPIFALFGVFLLFLSASIIIYFQRIGLILGLISSLMIVPYGINVILGIIEDGVLNLGILLAVPFLLVLLTIYLSITYLKKYKEIKLPVHNIINIILAIIPVLLIILYLFFYGKFWSLNEFIIHK
jgi:hypothetical protein